MYFPNGITIYFSFIVVTIEFIILSLLSFPPAVLPCRVDCNNAPNGTFHVCNTNCTDYMACSNGEWQRGGTCPPGLVYNTHHLNCFAETDTCTLESDRGGKHYFANFCIYLFE